MKETFQRPTSLMEPDSKKARDVVLDRRSYVREIGIGILLPMALPLVIAIGLYFANSGFNGLTVAVFTLGGSALTAIPIIFYASLRLNAATLARERTIHGGSTPKIYPPAKRPFSLGSFVAWSWRSLTIAGLPASVGFGMVFLLLPLASGGSILTPVSVLVAIKLIVELFFACSLLL